MLSVSPASTNRELLDVLLVRTGGDVDQLCAWVRETALAPRSVGGAAPPRAAASSPPPLAPMSPPACAATILDRDPDGQRAAFAYLGAVDLSSAASACAGWRVAALAAPLWRALYDAAAARLGDSFGGGPGVGSAAATCMGAPLPLSCELLERATRVRSWRALYVGAAAATRAAAAARAARRTSTAVGTHMHMPPALDDDDDDDEQPVRAAAGHAVAEVAAPPTLVSTAVGVQATAFDDGADAGATSASVGVGTTVDVGTSVGVGTAAIQGVLAAIAATQTDVFLSTFAATQTEPPAEWRVAVSSATAESQTDRGGGYAGGAALVAATQTDATDAVPPLLSSTRTMTASLGTGMATGGRVATAVAVATQSVPTVLDAATNP